MRGDFFCHSDLREPEATEESLNTRCFVSLSMTKKCKVGTGHQFLRKEPLKRIVLDFGGFPVVV